MKPGAVLVNTSRGAIVDEAAVLDALESGRLGAYGTDVIDGEWRDDLDRHPLIAYARDHDNCVITPHVGGVTFESQAMAYGHAARMLVEYFKKRGISFTGLAPICCTPNMLKVACIDHQSRRSSSVKRIRVRGGRLRVRLGVRLSACLSPLYTSPHTSSLPLLGYP